MYFNWISAYTVFSVQAPTVKFIRNTSYFKIERLGLSKMRLNAMIQI